MIETERLILRPLEAGDAADVVYIVNDESFITNIGDRGIRDEAGARRQIAAWAATALVNMAVIARESGSIVGTCGLMRRPFLDAPDLGYAFLPAGRGKGYAREAGRAMLQHGWRHSGLERVLAIVDPDNAASIRVLAALGFVDDGRIEHPDTGKTLRLFAVTPGGPA